MVIRKCKAAEHLVQMDHQEVQMKLQKWSSGSSGEMMSEGTIPWNIWYK
jgi:hypothetical protein